VGSIASLAVGLGAYFERRWARRVLIGITAIAILVCLVYAYFVLTRSINTHGAYAPWWIFFGRLLCVGEALRAIAPPVFFLFVLLHPDVARSFKTTTTETS
jgi:hypothetical protein